MGKRRDRFNLRIVKQGESKSVNTPLKIKERARRNARMRAAIKEGKFPYNRLVRSWLCERVGKKEYQLQPADVERALAAQ